MDEKETTGHAHVASELDVLEPPLFSATPRSALVEIRLVNVHFPFEPYEIQKDYMSAVIECLQKRWNGLLESPTGTGKTLSLLCASLAWLEDRKAALQLQGTGGTLAGLRSPDPQIGYSSVPSTTSGSLSSSFDRSTQILYSSRTHSQLLQASRELKRTRYGYMNSIVLGSRDQLCINSEVNTLPSSQQKIRRCQVLVNTRACEFYRNYETKVSHQDYSKKHVIDIEDLVTLGRRHQCCPYYATKILRKKSDVIFVPYNYIVDPSTRRSQAIELDGNVVIFDEAHNIESFCEDSLSFSMSSTDLAASVKELDGISATLVNGENADTLDFDVNELSVLKTMLLELEQKFDNASETGKHYDGDFLVVMLKETEIDAQHEKIIGLLDSILKYIQSVSTQGIWGPKGAGLQKTLDMLNTVYSGGTLNQLKKSFKLYFEQQKETTKEVFVIEKKKKKWDLCFVCLAPGVRMNSIIMAGVHSLILTSGTLSPMKTLATELGVPFQVQLSNDHIITPDKIAVMCIPQGPDRTELISTYQNRKNDKYIRSLGLTINEMSRRIPHGILVFFPSFACMKSLVEQWNEMGIMKRLRENKLLLQEESGSASFTATIQCYRDAVVSNPQGAMLFAVCRGKSSEGVDFSDEYARAVVIIGIPYAPKEDNRVMLKMEYLNKYGSSGINGMAWYQIQAIRAINQAIGRVIRHRNDFGMILFLDKRFSEMAIVNELSKWVRNKVETIREFRKALVGVSTFFQAHNVCVRSRNTNFAEDNGSNYMGFINSAQRLPSEAGSSKVSTSQKVVIDVDEEVGKTSRKLVEFYKNTRISGDTEITAIRSKSVLEAVEEFSKQRGPVIDSLPTLVGLKKRSSEVFAKKEVHKRKKLNVPLHDMLGGDKANVKVQEDADAKLETMGNPFPLDSSPSKSDERNGTQDLAIMDSTVYDANRRKDALEVMKNIMSEFQKHCNHVADWRTRVTEAIKTYRQTHDLSLFCHMLSDLLVDAKAQLGLSLLLNISKLTPKHKSKLGMEIIARVVLRPNSSEAVALKNLADNLNVIKSAFIVVQVLRWVLEGSDQTKELKQFFGYYPPCKISTDEFNKLYAQPLPSQKAILERIKSAMSTQDYRVVLRALKNFTINKDVTVLVNDMELRSKLSDDLREDFVMLLNVRYYVDFMVGMCK
ncbi:regulator of telomere elongation helicase 1 homolog [Varroa jacobsoni]|uniref:regulator of telomere elongation helicase 1 homolog n=1 Tax=Varroa jacobsoni TaxID=62625 RepID=UPI000BF63D2C|nr:regulator of telomere elongation helicase 1 homolog [Varroa jacobsoni]XP_022696008.1 regulator of telomere elongation helicase 1 homolog [Varroa jacobsoni]